MAAKIDDGKHHPFDNVPGPDSDITDQTLAEDKKIILYPASDEMKFWNDACECFVAQDLENQTCIQRLVGRIFVVPLTNLTGFSLYYQSYLTEIFHTRFLTKLSHYSMMPLVNFFVMVWLAQWTFSTQPSHRVTDVFVANGAMVYAIVVLFWWTLWGFISKTRWLGPGMLMPLFLLYILSTLYYQLTRELNPSIRKWYQPCYNVWYNPIIWMWVAAFFQAAGHAFEGVVPPRVNGSTHWLSIRATIESGGCSGVLAIFFQIFFGTFDEFIASPRLLPLLFIRVAYGMGYMPEQWQLIQTLASLALAHGNPALDYIGEGGGIPLEEAMEHDKNVRDAAIQARTAIEVFDPPHHDGDIPFPKALHATEKGRKLRDHPHFKRLVWQVLADMKTVADWRVEQNRRACASGSNVANVGSNTPAQPLLSVESVNSEVSANTIRSQAAPPADGLRLRTKPKKNGLMTFCNHGHANHMKGFHLVFPGVPKEHLRRYRAQNAAT